jgi:Fe-S-cluster-containing hydrogenase component 2
MLPHLSPQIGDRVTRMPGVSVTVSDRCTGCGLCAQEICFAGAIELAGGRALIGEGCRGCGRCVEVCPHGAIELTVQQGRFIEESVRRIAPLVDLR